MVFDTSESLCDAIKKADNIIHQAIHNGDVVSVLANLCGGLLVSNFFHCWDLSLIKKKSDIFHSNHASLFPEGFPEEYFMFKCCQEWIMASKNQTLDIFLERQQVVLEGFN